MKKQTIIMLAIALIAVAALTVRSQQQSWIEQAREISNRQPLATPPQAVILGLEVTYHVEQDDYGSYAVNDAMIVEYATVSTNGPVGIVRGMNAADAIAIIHARGMRLVRQSSDGLIFAGPN